jgi:hypothetical protein
MLGGEQDRSAQVVGTSILVASEYGDAGNWVGFRRLEGGE